MVAGDTRDLTARDLLVHVGFHKAGSTWVQRGLFVDRDAGFTSPWSTELLRSTFVRVDPYRFDACAAAAVLRAEIEAARRAGLMPVASHERLSGSPHAGAVDALAIADRLVATVPHARILIVIREQVSMVVSNYKQHVKVGGIVPLARYVKPVEKGGDPEVNQVLRRLRWLDEQLPGPVHRWFERRLLDEARRVIGDRYGASNRRATAMTGLDLAGSGYGV